MKKTLTTIAGIITLAFLGNNCIVNGSPLRTCAYTEKRYPVPKAYQNVELPLPNGSYLVLGRIKDYSCLIKFGRIDKHIAPVKRFMSDNYYAEQGLTLGSIEPGSSLHVVDFMSVTEHGINTIDSVGNNNFYFIVEDQDQNRYSLPIFLLDLEYDDFFTGITPIEELLWPKRGRLYE